jgi:hypothetical protein
MRGNNLCFVFLLNLSNSEDSDIGANDYEYTAYLHEKYYKTFGNMHLICLKTVT